MAKATAGGNPVIGPVVPRVAHGIAEMAWMDYYVRGTGKPFTWKDVLATIQPARR